MSNVPRPARPGALVTTLALAALALGAAPAAGDPPPGAGEEPPGNRGTVKIHEASTPDDDRRDEPHVCEFRIVGFGFPSDADLLVTIEGHGGPNAGVGSFTADLGSGAVDAEGDFAIDGPALPDGMYRLAVDNRTAPGGAKQKVFHVECPGAVGGIDGATTSTTEAPATTTTSSTTTSSTTTSTTSTSTTLLGAGVGVGEATAPASGVAAGSLVRGENGSRAAATEVLGAQQVRGRSASGALALTGVEVGALLAAGVLLLIGGELLRRRIRPA